MDDHITNLQEWLDKSRPKDRKLLMKRFKQETGEVPMIVAVAALAIMEKISAARAWEIVRGAAADGKLPVTGIKGGSSHREQIPLSVFQQGRA